MKKIAIFASGSGSNAENIARYFEGNSKVEVSVILTNNPNAFVLSRAKDLKIPSYIFSRNEFYKSDDIIRYLTEKEIDFIVLAGFLWLLPINLLRKFPDSILNIHPALLPKYGGKGMFGMKVHEAVVRNKEKESGITIHLVNENYDEGKVIFQSKCKLNPDDTPEQVAEKVHQLEYEYFPKIIEQLL
ncbi:phosphoribosylglycinamide formyltransferase [Ancylomarina longa]|uniref:Phosphoribosylglycinamide formyltransferase n=1 Tax=Ancylomarina longa TaxID=2487017 RepID=A0A434AUR2_9BACT|nr:phosphoribosylglycinamide formyltransferase [Ancylomarina longa]RUT78089.1 phosphoribosylglycinamide formyltransferase [Ancylomarina longa]